MDLHDRFLDLSWSVVVPASLAHVWADEDEPDDAAPAAASESGLGVDCERCGRRVRVEAAAAWSCRGCGHDLGAPVLHAVLDPNVAYADPSLVAAVLLAAVFTTVGDADGAMKTPELSAIRRFLRSRAGVPAKALPSAMRLVDAVRDKRPTLNALADGLLALAEADPRLRKLFVAMLLSFAICDRALQAGEAEEFEAFARMLSVADPQRDHAVRRYLASRDAEVLKLYVPPLFAHVLACDGAVAPRESAAASSALDRYFGARRDSARLGLQRALETPGQLDALTAALRGRFGAPPAEGESLVVTLLQLAVVDRPLNAQEDKVIHAIAGALGLSDAAYVRTRSTFAPGLSEVLCEHYATLEISPFASDDEFKTHSRNLINEYHPDRVSQYPVPPKVKDDFKRLLTEQLAKINESVAAIKSARRI